MFLQFHQPRTKLISQSYSSVELFWIRGKSLSIFFPILAYRDGKKQEKLQHSISFCQDAKRTQKSRIVNSQISNIFHYYPFYELQETLVVGTVAEFKGYNSRLQKQRTERTPTTNKIIISNLADVHVSSIMFWKQPQEVKTSWWKSLDITESQNVLSRNRPTRIIRFNS